MKKKVPNRWSHESAMKLGAITGAVMIVWNTFVTGDATDEGASGFIGYAFGSILGGVLIFCGVTALRNRLVLGKQERNL